MKLTRRDFLADLGTLSIVISVCKEMYRRQNHPGDSYVPDDDPKGDQLAFHQSPARTRLLFGGNQSGKSRAAAQEVKWWLEGTHPYQRTPQAPKIYVLSADYRTLSEGIYRHLLGSPKNDPILHEWEIVGYGSQIPGTKMHSWIEHANGGVCNFISGEGGEKARKKVQSAAVDLIEVDEEIPGDMWTELQARRLTYGAKVVVSATLVRSEDWLLELEERADSGTDDNAFITRLDTKRAVERGHIDPVAYDEMNLGLTEEERHVRLRGGSRRRQGLVYPEFGKIHLAQPFRPHKTWTKYCSIDPGRRTCAVLWGAVSPDERLHVYREGYFHGRTYHDLAKFICEVEGWEYDKLTGKWRQGESAEAIHVRWIDPHAFDHAVSGQPGIATLLAADYQIYTSPSPNAVHYGIEKIHQLLMKGMDEVPGILVTKECKNLIREFRSYKWVDDRGSTYAHERKDQPIKRNDHALDALRYMVTGGIKFDRTNQKYKELKQKLEKVRDIESMGSTNLGDRLGKWWAERELANRRGQRSKGSYIGGIGDD